MRQSFVVSLFVLSTTACAGSKGDTAGAASAAAAPVAGSASSVPPVTAAPAGSGTAMPSAAAGGGAMATSQATDANEWQPLIEGAWELPAGQEGYYCARLTVQEDLYIKEFQPIAPQGTHHTLLSINETPVGPDGTTKCTAADNGHTTLLGSGVGENYSAGPLPDGVAYKISKGWQLNMNLHLFNVQDSVLKGVSGTKVRLTTADKVQETAEVILAGPVSLQIPVGRSTSTGKCTVMSDTTVFAVSPHMHQLGAHLKAFVTGATRKTVMLYDGPYDFEQQRQFSANQLALKKGDVVQVECTYENTTDSVVGFGESSLDEMCFLGIYRYPVAGEGLICLR